MYDGPIIRQQSPALAGEHYPDCDGLPMAANDTHYHAIQSIRRPLEGRYRRREDVYVTGDLLLYYQRYDTTKSLAPDVMVVMGTSRHLRRNYLLWEESRMPDVVVEVSSPDSFQSDRVEKRQIYGALGFREYFLYRPDYGEAERAGQMRAYRQWGGQMVEATQRGTVRGEPEYASEVLGVGFRSEGNRVRLRDLTTGRDLLRIDELSESIRVLREERKQEEQARRIAEQERDQHIEARRIAEKELLLTESRIAELKARLAGEE